MAQDWKGELGKLRDLGAEDQAERQPQARLRREVAVRYACPSCGVRPGWRCRKTWEGRDVETNRCCQDRYAVAWSAGERPWPQDTPPR